MDEFVRNLERHVAMMRNKGGSVDAVRINDTEAERCGIADATTIMGLPIVHDNSLQNGHARLDCTGCPWKQYEFYLPEYCALEW